MIKKVGKLALRIVLVSLYAMLTLMLVSFARQADTEFHSTATNKGLFIFLYILLFNLNTEGNFYFSKYLNTKISWSKNLKKRIIIQLGFLFVWTIITIAIPFSIWYIINGMSFAYPPASVIIFISAVVFLLIFNAVSITVNFFKNSQKYLLDIEHYKQEKLKADYKVLQNQVNPHFLFNSLNVLISEIKHNPNTAVEFTRKLSKVYRYVLQSKNHDLISLKEELAFIDSFIYLHKIRIGNSLEYTTNISKEVMQMEIPPCTLQLLIENAIKHNVANEENVLKISIESGSDNTLTVSNNLQIIDTVNSTYTGLANLSKRFELIKKEGFTYGKQEAKFVVTIPLIEE